MRFITASLATVFAVGAVACDGPNADHNGMISSGSGAREDASVPIDSAVANVPEAVCGNGITEPGETCDGLCPADCDNGDPCTVGIMHGSPETCDAYCIQEDIEHIDGDGCCPLSANANTDDDCPPVCGNFIMESGEACDDGNTVGGDSCSADCTLHLLCPGGVREGDYTIDSDQDKQRFIGCAKIAGNLDIQALDLDNLEGLNLLTSVNGNVRFWGNSALTDFAGLEGLTTIGGDLVIETNGAITSLNGLHNLETLDGRLYIDNNSMLSDLSALSRLTSIGGSLQINNSPGLTDLQGLNNLASVGQDLELRSNEWLVTLDGLDSLASVGALVFIYQNPRLCNLRALGRLASVGGGVTVHDNQGLPTCEAQWLQERIGIDNIDGLVIIHGNDDRGVCL